MQGIDLNQPILYKHSSLRFFNAGEYHISRLCEDDVLLLVYDGVLRFTEDSVPYELHPGSYHIQRHGSVQTGHLPSDAPKYLYVHFLAEWSDSASSLPSCGMFNYAKLKPMRYLANLFWSYIGWRLSAILRKRRSSRMRLNRLVIFSVEPFILIILVAKVTSFFF